MENFKFYFVLILVHINDFPARFLCVIPTVLTQWIILQSIVTAAW